MRFIKILSSIVFSIIIIIAIGGYFAVRNFDLNKYKVYAEEMVENELGRKLKINGEASLGISLVPTVIINDVALANPSWAQNPQMVTLKQAEVKFALLPLFKKQIVIDKVILVEPEIFLEKSNDGQVNWEFPALSAKANKAAASAKVPAALADNKTVQTSSAVAMAGFAAKNVSIRNGKVEYYDAKANQLTNLVINDISLSVPSYADQIALNFDVLYNQEEINGQAELGSLAQLMEGKEPFPFLLTTKAMGISAELNGSVADVMSAPRYAVEANIYNPAGNFDAPETTLKTRIDGDTKELSAKIETLNIVNNIISGTASVRWDSKVPQITADLQSPAINLQSFNQNSNFAFQIPSLISEAQALESVPNTPIPYELLYGADANLKLAVGQLAIAPGMVADNVKMDAVLKSGRLAVKPLEFDFGGGNINADLTVDANAKSVALKASSKNMLLQNLHKEFMVSGSGDFGIKSGGNLDLDINLVGSGTTYRQLAQNLKGQVIGIVDKSVIQTGGLQFIGGNFVTQLLAALGIDTSKSTDMDLTCAVVRADLGGGKAKFPKGIALDSKQLTIVSDGNINLVNDNIAFTIEPSFNKLANGNITQALASFIKVVGTLEQPQIRLDDEQALKTVVGVVATGGVAYLGSQVMLNGSGAPCYTALEGTPYASRFPKPTGVRATTQDVYNDATKQIKDSVKGSVKDLKNTAKDLLDAFRGF